MANNLEQLLFTGRITATSNRQNEDFKTDPRKTAYITVSSETQRKKLIDFGLTEYTSKEDNQPFFIIKMGQELRVFVNGKQSILDTNAVSENFSTTEEIGIAVLKGKANKSKITYNRIFALNLPSRTVLETTVPKNPFEMEDDFDNSGATVFPTK